MKKSLVSIISAIAIGATALTTGCVTTVGYYEPAPVIVSPEPYYYVPPPVVVVPGPYIYSNPHHWHHHHFR